MALPSIFRGSPSRGLKVRAGDPWHSPFDQLFDELWRGFDTAPIASETAGFVPRVDLVETADSYRVRAELPGLEEKDFQLEIHDGVLSLHGEKLSEQEHRSEGWHRSERSFGRFQRTIRLPREVDADKASASYEHGVLTVLLPKAESARVREIPVSGA